MLVISKLAVHLTSFGIGLTLVWFGRFKYTPFQADEIVTYVKSSPFLSWMHKRYGFIKTAGVLGTVEIIAGLALIAGLFFPLVGFIGSVLAVLIFCISSTLFFSTPGMTTRIDGMWVPTEAGSFVIKDFALLGAALFLLSDYTNKI